MKPLTKYLGIASLILALTGGILYNSGNVTEANKRLREFPNSLPRTASIRKFEVPGAKHCLVHIRQLHLVEYDLNKSSEILPNFTQEKNLKKLNSHQQEIYQILDNLRTNSGINSVYLEGIDSNNWPRIQKAGLENFLEEGNPSLEREITDLEYKTYQKIIWDIPERETSESLREKYTQELEAKKKELKDYKETMRYVQGGGLRMVADGKLQPRFGEDSELIARLDKIDPNWAKKINYDTLDARENALLKLISLQDDCLAVVEYGGAHAWGGKDSCGKSYSLEGRNSQEDNLAIWNKKYPQNKFSLIEITPKSYK